MWERVCPSRPPAWCPPRRSIPDQVLVERLGPAGSNYRTANLGLLFSEVQPSFTLKTARPACAHSLTHTIRDALTHSRAGQVTQLFFSAVSPNAGVPTSDNLGLCLVVSNPRCDQSALKTERATGRLKHSSKKPTDPLLKESDEI